MREMVLDLILRLMGEGASMNNNNTITQTQSRNIFNFEFLKLVSAN